MINEPLQPYLRPAAWWERQLEREGMPTQLPYNVALGPKLQRKYERIATDLAQQSGDEPTPNDVAEKLKLSREKNIVRAFGQRVLWVEATDRTMLTDDEVVEEIVMHRAMQRRVHEVIFSLPDDECQVMTLRTGLNGHIRSYGDIGGLLGITPERVRHLEQSALEKLCHPSNKRRVSDFITDIEY